MKTLLILEEHLSVVGVDELFSFVGSPLLFCNLVLNFSDMIDLTGPSPSWHYLLLKSFSKLLKVSSDPDIRLQ